MEPKKKERKKQRKKPYSSNNSIDNLMAEMPFAGADIELELSSKFSWLELWNFVRLDIHIAVKRTGTI